MLALQAPLRCFAVFCGLLIVFDYIMCVLLVFPALCIYDSYNTRPGTNCCCSITCCGCGKRADHREESAADLGDSDGEEGKPSLIRRILKGFYTMLHNVRWPLLVVCFGALVVSAIYAARLELPKNSDVRLLNSNNFQEELAYEWRRNLLSASLENTAGNPGYVIWGTTPADTGNHNNPDTWSQLVLDEDFDPSSKAAQTYLRDFCGRFFTQDFASKVDIDYECPINEFDTWLQVQANATESHQEYQDHCDNAFALPMDPEFFHDCVTGWTQATGMNELLTRNDVMKVMFVRFQQRVRFDSPFPDLDKEWNLIEVWMEHERQRVAPEGVNKMYHSSGDFWWYDTNGKMLDSAYSAAAIALSAAGLVVLCSSRSIVLTIFSLVTIGYVLTSTTAMLVASGWTLGFLESVCFSILIGISCDFVIHFGHAYAFLKGQDEVTRHERTQHALIFMGPSILAAGFTTICGALVMIFTVISFFQRFATILFYTIIQATAASFIVFLTLTDTMGPNRPTFLVDKVLEGCCGKDKDAEASPSKGVNTMSVEGGELGDKTDHMKEEGSA